MVVDTWNLSAYCVFVVAIWVLGLWWCFYYLLSVLLGYLVYALSCGFCLGFTCILLSLCLVSCGRCGCLQLLVVFAGFVIWM